MKQTRLPAPSDWPMGEIRFEDGTKMFVPQPTRDLWFTLDEAYVSTLPELPSPVEVQTYAEKHSDSNAPQRTAPRWAVVCIVLGGLLSVGVGAFFIGLWWIS